ncbi:hypothetical protein RND81_09G080200 [Saponaria officinalis]|uniref:Peptidase A1 domain-containing protein n=1 Tax=Saponaria officinalis TaxID=3572 RepID=A0AAW1IK96_SAPOF
MTRLLFVLLHMIIPFILVTNALVLKMIPIESHHLQILKQHSSAQERHKYLTNLSLSRAHKNTRKKLVSPNTFSAPLYEVHSNYFVTQLVVGEGAGKTSPFVLLDTSETETWVQCEGCDPCIEAKYKNFNHTKSTNYVRMDLEDTLCSPRLNYRGSCGFNITYPKSKTSGFLGRDTFYFKNSKTQYLDGYNGLAFGCGIQNEGFEFGDNKGPTNSITGVHGLAPGNRSFINQLDHYIKGRFSYCIPSLTEMEFTMSTMYFGDDAQISGDATRQVQIISMNTEIGYHLYLNDISVEGNRLQIDPSIFEFDPSTPNKGFIIDSGAPYTILTKSAYDPLQTAVTKLIEDTYGLKPEPRNGTFPLCYKNYPKDDTRFPSITFHFTYKEQAKEVDMVLDKDHVFLQVNDGFCMTLISTDDPGPSLLGAFQQANFKILYDISNRLLHFVPQRCNESDN